MRSKLAEEALFKAIRSKDGNLISSVAFACGALEREIDQLKQEGVIPE